MKKLGCLFLLFAVFSFSPLYAAEKKSEPITLKFGHYITEKSWYGQSMKWWVNEAEKRTNGRLKIQMFWMESLIKHKDALPALQSRIVDLTFLSSTYHPSNLPLFMMIDNVQNCGDDYIASLLAVDETMANEPNLKAELEREKIIMMIPHSSGNSPLATKKPLNSLSELRGKTFRTYGGARVKWYDQFNANAIFMPYPDIYEAVDRGTVFGSDIGILLSDGFKHYEVMKYIMKIRLGASLAAGTFMNRDQFLKFPKDIQKILLDLRKDYIVYFGQRLMDDESKCLARWEKDHGVKVIELSQEDQKLNQAAGKKAQELLLAEQVKSGHKMAPETWNYYKNALARIEKERAKK